MESTMPFPSLRILVSASASSSDEVGPAGSLNVSTWPLDRPTVSNGSVGWIAVVKMSASSGSVQRFSNMASKACSRYDEDGYGMHFGGIEYGIDRPIDRCSKNSGALV
jgi:hypothetical protein